MRLEGSCHCGAVRFRVESPHPYPYQRCYCSICRKTAGGGGYAINLGARTDTLDPGWPELVHPFASAIDSDLPVPPERVHLLLDSKASWVEVEARDNDRCFAGYPEESLAEWHRRLGLEC